MEKKVSQSESLKLFEAKVSRQGGMVYVFNCDCEGGHPVAVSCYLGARAIAIGCLRCGRCVSVEVLSKRGRSYVQVSESPAII